MEKPQLESIVKKDVPFVDEITASVNVQRQVILPADMKKTFKARQKAKKAANCLVYMRTYARLSEVNVIADLTDMPSGEFDKYALVNLSEDGRFVLHYRPQSRKVKFIGRGNSIEIYEA